MTGNKQGTFLFSPECAWLSHPHLPKEHCSYQTLNNTDWMTEFAPAHILYMYAGFLPKQVSHQNANASASASIAILTFRYLPTCLCSSRIAVWNWIKHLLLLHDCLLQLVLSRSRVFSVPAHDTTRRCHSTNHALNGPHSLFCTLHFMGFLLSSLLTHPERLLVSLWGATWSGR